MIISLLLNYKIKKGSIPGSFLLILFHIYGQMNSNIYVFYLTANQAYLALPTLTLISFAPFRYNKHAPPCRQFKNGQCFDTFFSALVALCISCPL
jgi:hypothetical protein